jgi:hypothetical protein
LYRDFIPKHPHRIGFFIIMATESNEAKVPYRQIRARYDDETITVYQAYKSSIASAAVAAQKLNASPDFSPGRMTWIKPSWAWMMYRAGYSYKDPRQERILALKMKHEHFIGLLDRGVLSTHVQKPAGDDSASTKADKGRVKSSDVRIQWDPERNHRIESLPYRSIQIGVPGALSDTWANEWIVQIDDVTDAARELKRVLDERPDVSLEELRKLGLIPVERPFAVPDAIITKLDMTVPDTT